jgi:hypothetical protein
MAYEYDPKVVDSLASQIAQPAATSGRTH